MGNIAWSKGQWTKAATLDIIRIGGAMLKTGAGSEVWDAMDQSDIDITMNISSDSKKVLNDDGAASVVFGMCPVLK